MNIRTIRFPEEVEQLVIAKAKREYRSINSVVIDTLSKSLGEKNGND